METVRAPSDSSRGLDVGLNVGLDVGLPRVGLGVGLGAGSRTLNSSSSAAPKCIELIAAYNHFSQGRASCQRARMLRRKGLQYIVCSLDTASAQAVSNSDAIRRRIIVLRVARQCLTPFSCRRSWRYWQKCQSKCLSAKASA